MRKKSHLLALLIGLAFTTLSAVGLFLVSSVAMRSEMHEQGQSIVARIDTITQEITETFFRLSKSDLLPCSDDYLNMLRQLLFETVLIRDIGYRMDNGVICTASLGRLKNPIPLTAPTYQGKYEIWLNSTWYLQSSSLKATLAGWRSHIIAIEPSKTFSYMTMPYKWEVFFSWPGTDSHYFAAGTSEVLRATSNHPWITGVHHITLCSKRVFYCAATEGDVWRFLERNRVTTILSILFSALLGWMSYIQAYRWLEYRGSIGHRVKRGLKCDNFFPLFQPIVDLNRDRVVGCEVLARFHDKHGSIDPTHFVPVIRTEKLTTMFTKLIIEKSLVALRSSGLEQKLRVSLNVFPSDIADGSVLEIQKLPVLKDWSGSIVLELTEDQELNSDCARDVLKKLSEIGFLLAIDDFGTGYSNLNYLHKLDCNFLKIDQSFIKDMEEGSVRSAIIPHIVEISIAAKLALIAEGIENDEQARALLAMGVQYGQGWLFGKAINTDELAEMVRDKP